MADLVMERGTHGVEYVRGIRGIRFYYDREKRQDRVELYSLYFTCDIEADFLKWDRVEIRPDPSEHEYAELTRTSSVRDEYGEVQRKETIRIVVCLPLTVEAGKDGWITVRPHNGDGVASFLPGDETRLDIYRLRRPCPKERAEEENEEPAQAEAA